MVLSKDELFTMTKPQFGISCLDMECQSFYMILKLKDTM